MCLLHGRGRETITTTAKQLKIEMSKWTLRQSAALLGVGACEGLCVRLLGLL